MTREVQALRQQLQALLDAARENERKLDRFDALEWRLISVESMEELVALLMVECRHEFGLDAAELWLLDPEGELRRALPSLPMAQEPRLLDDHRALVALFAGQRSTRLLGPSEGALLRQAFGPQTQMRSAALLPLIRQGVLIGSLHLGSRDAQRYELDAGTKFLDRLGAIAAISIESMLNRERLRRAGLTDSLTGLHNRRYFDHRSQIEFSQALRHGYPLACLFLDIDRFKSINDGHGHAAGDEVLRQVGGLVLRALRVGDLAARYGGEEFVLMLPRTEPGGALEVAERIRRLVETSPLVTPEGQTVQATISIGLASLSREGGASLATLVSTADRALYRAKAEGRNRVVCASTVAPA